MSLKSLSLIQITGLLLVCQLLTWTNQAWAWNDLGHITIARIAYSQMSGEERQAVVEILKQHPHFDVYFKKPAELDVPEDEWLFLRAATWCDFIRPPRGADRDQIQQHPIQKFHRGPWHYVNFPYRPGQDTTRLPTALLAPDAEQTDVLEQLQMTHGVLTGRVTRDGGQVPGLSAAQNKAVRLCWLFHLVGDLHQPLHAVALVDRELFPGPNHGDNGGNFVMIRTHAMAKPSNLHAFWDNSLGYTSGWQYLNRPEKRLVDIQKAREKAELLTHNPIYTPEKLTEIASHRRYVDWAFESFQLAASTAYDGGNLKFVSQKQLDERTVAREDVPILPAVQQEKAHAVANRRVTVAGYRLAEQLREILARR